MSFRPHTTLRPTPGGGMQLHTEMRHVSTSMKRPSARGPGGGSDPGLGAGVFLVLLLLCCAGVFGGQSDQPEQGDGATAAPATAATREATAPHAGAPTGPARPGRSPSRGAQHFDVELAVQCHGTPGQCTVLIRSNPGSTGDFVWSAASRPAGAHFTPRSGRVPRGTVSGPIAVAAGSTCPMTFTFRDDGGFTATGRAC